MAPIVQKHIANAVGIVVLALASFGIDVTPEQQAQIISGLAAIGLVINTILNHFHDNK